MSVLLILSRLLSSAVFLAAALGKIADPGGSRKSMRGFGLPAVLAAAASILLPIGELAVALALLSTTFAWYGAVGALCLLGLFIAAIAVALARGLKPDCHCFGQLHSKPVSPALIARNIALAMLPAFIVYGGRSQPDIIAWIDGAAAGHQLAFLLAAIAIVVMFGHWWLTLQLVQQGGRVLLRLDELENRQPQVAVPQQQPQAPQQQPQGVPVGAAAPDFALPDLNGSTVSLEHLTTGTKPALLLFVHPDCGPCGDLLKEASTWQMRMAAHLHFAIISQGSAKDNVSKLKGTQFPYVLLQKERETAAAYAAPATPSAVVVSPDRRIASPVAVGAEAIRSLVASVINKSLASLVSISATDNEAATRLVLPDLDGKLMLVSELVDGHPSVLMFWNPACGYCQQMLPDLKAWEKQRARNGRRLILISTGSVEDNRKMGLGCPILIDAGFTAGRAFGATGTPSGILLDSDGKVSSMLAVGRDHILTLLQENNAAVATAS